MPGALPLESRPPAPSPRLSALRTAVQAELRSGWALPAAIPRSRDPWAPPPFAPRSYRDSPPPGVRRASPRPRPWGSIGSLATRGRRSRASAPSPAWAAQDAASEQRPRGSGPRPGPAPGQPGRRGSPESSRSRPPGNSGVGGGNETELGYPGQRRRAPHPRLSPLARYPPRARA